MKYFISILSACIFAGCTISKNSNAAPLTVQQIAYYKICGNNESGQLNELTKKESFESYLEKLNLDNSLIDSLDIDLNKNRYFFYFRGSVANTGYGLKIKPEANVIDHTIIVQIDHTLPDPDRMYPQVMQSPCIFFSLPKSNFKNVIIEN